MRSFCYSRMIRMDKHIAAKSCCYNCVSSKIKENNKTIMNLIHI